MNIQGLDYNTKREKLVLPEYGREVQKMVEYAIGLPTKEERQQCAETIISVMDRMETRAHADEGYRRKLWDHLALMSNFKLDIDYPYDVSEAKKIAAKPEPMEYPMKRIPVRHYGNMVFELFDKLKSMPAGDERDALMALTANQMKRDLVQWGHGSSDDEKVASDLARFTDGVIQLDLDKFTFDKVSEKTTQNTQKRKKK